MDGICLKRGRGGLHRNASELVAMGIDDEVCYEAIGAVEGVCGSSRCSHVFLSWPIFRGLRGVRLLTNKKVLSMVG